MFGCAMKLILKSFLTGVLGTCLFFSFLMPMSVAVLAVVDRLTVDTGNTKSVIVDPTTFLQHVGLPLAALVFVACFGFGIWHFRQLTPQESSGSR
jgi:hypothetical protein